jgi:hypothetical protein
VKVNIIDSSGVRAAHIPLSYSALTQIKFPPISALRRRIAYPFYRPTITRSSSPERFISEPWRRQIFGLAARGFGDR